jgi:hypothetical protein
MAFEWGVGTRRALRRTGLHPLAQRVAHAGIASGLINTTQPICGAIGTAVVTTIAATATANWVTAHPGTASTSGTGLTHGFSTAFDILAGVAPAGAAISALLVESRPTTQAATATQAEAALEAA